MATKKIPLLVAHMGSSAPKNRVKSIAVQYAHYTVTHYLKSTRVKSSALANGIISLFTFVGRHLFDVIIRMTFVLELYYEIADKIRCASHQTDY